MSAITYLTRTWLTHSFQPFLFTNEYDRQLSYEACENLGLYIHIPFCESICDFCPYCKRMYSEALCDRYLDALLQEIHMVGCQMRDKKTVTSLYFGGGTPALIAERIGEIIAAVKEHFMITEGIGVELHPDNVRVPVLGMLREAGVTKISIGVQSFQDKFQQILGRKPVDLTAMAAALEAVAFETVSMDFIFALPGQTFADLKTDIDTAFAKGANHVAIYPFIDFTFTDSQVKALPKKVSTLSLPEGVKYSSMTRDNFLGFGCSATTLLKEQFKINTFSVEEYCERIRKGELPTSLTLRFTRRQRMVYYLFWTAYSTRVNEADFEKFFGVPLKRMYGTALRIARILGFVTYEDGIYRMTLKGAFYYHYYENFYTLSYIDKMWGIMRKEAFPEQIRL